MRDVIVSLPDIVILSGASVSQLIKADLSYGDATSICSYAPAALDALTFTIEVTDDPDHSAPTFRTLQAGGADVAPPGAGKASVIENPSFAGFRYKSSGNVAADRRWAMTKQIESS